MDDIAHEIVGREIADRAGRAGRLIDVAVVEYHLVAPCGLGVEIMLPTCANDSAPVVAVEPGLLRRLRGRRAIEAIIEQRHRRAPRRRDAAHNSRATALKWIDPELVERQTERQPRIDIVVDDLQREAVVRRRLIAAEEIHGLSVEPSIAGEAVAACIAREQRGVEIADFLSRDEVIVEVAEAAAVDAVLDAVNA